MSTASKFGISAAGVDGRAILQPKLKYRYRVKFNMGSTSPLSREFTRNVVTCDRPKLSATEIQIHSYNSIAYISGKHEWQTINCTFRDDVNNSIVGLVGTQLQKQIDHHEQASAKSAEDFKFGMTVDFLTGTHGTDGDLHLIFFKFHGDHCAHDTAQHRGYEQPSEVLQIKDASASKGHGPGE